MATATFVNGASSCFTPGINPFTNTFTGVGNPGVNTINTTGACCLIWDCTGCCYVCTPTGQCCPVAGCSTGIIPGVNNTGLPFNSFGGIGAYGSQNFTNGFTGVTPWNWQNTVGFPGVVQNWWNSTPSINSGFGGVGVGGYGCSPFGVSTPWLNCCPPVGCGLPYGCTLPFNCGPVNCTPWNTPYGCTFPMNCIPGYGFSGGIPFGYGSNVPSGSPFFCHPGQNGVQGDQQLRNNG